MSLDALNAFVDGVYDRSDYPATALQTENWAETMPLSGFSVLDATPVFRNTLLKYRALLAAGAELSVGVSDVVAKDSRIVDKLKEWNVPVVTAKDVSRNSFDLVLDCAGGFSRLLPRIGFVELTRSGVERYRSASRPVFVADSGKIKRIETSLGTGDGYFRAMEKLGYGNFKGSRFTVFGDGKVGAGIAAYALRRGAHVSVVTDTGLCPAKPLAGKELHRVDFRDDSAVAELLKDSDFVVTATGKKNALSAAAQAALLNTRAVLANMGVEDEYGETFPADRVLNGKRPLNFLLEEPTQLRYIDATFALHNALAEHLAELSAGGKVAPGLYPPPEYIEAELLDVTRERGNIPGELLRDFVD